MRSHAEKVAYTASLIAVAMMLSYLETLLPYLPIPGFKPGLANIATMVAFFYLGLPSAITVSLFRIALSSLLFASPVSLVFSLSGGLLSLCVLALYNAMLKNKLGLMGLGLLSSVAHCIGQSIAASILYGPSLLFTYLPWLILLAVPMGILTGTITYGIISRLKTRRIK